MSTSVYITDDGDETCFVRVEEEIIATISHEMYEWDGMITVIELVKSLGDAFGFEVYVEEDIV